MVKKLSGTFIPDTVYIEVAGDHKVMRCGGRVSKSKNPVLAAVMQIF